MHSISSSILFLNALSQQELLCKCVKRRSGSVQMCSLCELCKDQPLYAQEVRVSELWVLQLGAGSNTSTSILDFAVDGELDMGSQCSCRSPSRQCVLESSWTSKFEYASVT